GAEPRHRRTFGAARRSEVHGGSAAAAAAAPATADEDAEMSPYFEDHKADSTLGRRSLRGGAITIAARAVNGLIQVGSVFILARLLTPEDYGLVAMVTAMIGFAPVLVDFGSRDAIVQRERITEGEVSALFWIAIGV